MTVKNKMFQPGAILHEVIDGALRASGSSFDAWCRENEVHPSTARNATYGQSGGDRGMALREKIIADAGPDLVKAAYAKRVILEAQKLGSGVAA